MQGLGGGAVVEGGYRYTGVTFFFFLLCARGRGGGQRQGGIGGATSPLQELEVGALRAPYLLVFNI